MGTSRYQITTVNNLKGLYRYGFTGTTTYCPKYSAITGKSWYKVTFNTESEYKSINFNICPAYYNWYSTGYGSGSVTIFCKILSGSYTSNTDDRNIPVVHYYGTNTLMLFNKNNIYGQAGTLIALTGSTLMTTSNTDIIKWGCLARASINLTAGYNCSGSLSLNCNPIYTTSLSGYSDGLGADHTNTGNHTYGTPNVSGTSAAWWLVIIGPDGSQNTFTSTYAQASISYNFNVGTTGTYYFCLVPSYIEWQTQYNQYITGYVYNGIYLYINTSPYVSLPSRSYSSNMLVRYMDISIVSSRTLTVKVYNNKASKARLDNIYIYYDTSSSETTSGTQMTSISIGNVSGNSTASFTLTLSFPATVMASTSKYYVHVWCGHTFNNQTWSYKFGPSGSYSSTSKGTARVTTGIQLFRTSSTDSNPVIMPNIYCTSTMSEMTFQIT